MRLVRINQVPERFAWDVLAIADAEGYCVFWDELKAASSSDGAAEKMLGILERDVPMNGTPKNTRICNPLGNDIYEFKTLGLAGTVVLWDRQAGHLHPPLQEGQEKRVPKRDPQGNAAEG